MKQIIKHTFIWTSIIFLTFYHLRGQSNFLKKNFTIGKNKKSAIIPFKFIHNLIIIPLLINRSDTMHFILDTGVSATLVTSLDGLKIIEFEHTKYIDIYGLGVGKTIKGLISVNNYINLPHANVEGAYIDFLVLLEDVLHLSFNLSIPVHGLIGYDIFKSFVVEIDYINKHIILRKPEKYKKPKLKKNRFFIPISIENNKPYIYGEIYTKTQKKTRVKLLVDSGASYAISLFKDTHEDIDIPEKSFRSFLGVGISGNIYGSIGRINSFSIGKSELLAPIVNFPDREAIEMILINNNERNGSIGADILKRYRVIFDYNHREMILKPNRFFNKKFHYNMSGIDIITPFPGLNIYQVNKIRENSPAEKSGLKAGDNIYAINGLSTIDMSLEEVTNRIYGNRNKNIKLSIYREGILHIIRFKVYDIMEKFHHDENFLNKNFNGAP